ncbi:TetR/AcrR family transcriptional regulator [Pseudonocardia pini]|uniref:TetR/AcrR family transcriptional regulator n=1 Tax=Pseudonocardia pini TaxID=2758030 RepID=UPI0015F04CB6|nr:TetR/AcrR family transcriptional regulator [Pseudonocardia pini]
MSSTSASWRQRALTNSESVRRSDSRTIEVAQRLIDGARELRYEAGQPFTITQLTERVGIAGQTFYSYFRGKDELLLATYEDVVQDSITGIAEQAADEPDPVRRLGLIVEQVIRAAQRRPRAQVTAIEHARLAEKHPAVVAKVAAPFHDLVASTIIAGREAGMLASDDPGADARFLSDALFITFQNLALGVTTGPVEDVVVHARSFVLRALRPASEG